ncbi:hypothetical protein O5D80_000239 [Batrachochytrium dendrobatidis]|nr:hypothetical protein O5D80_000239 [Batrachochytrium dendrobatidis]
MEWQNVVLKNKLQNPDSEPIDSVSSPETIQTVKSHDLSNSILVGNETSTPQTIQRSLKETVFQPKSPTNTRKDTLSTCTLASSPFDFIPNQTLNTDTLLMQWLVQTDASTFITNKLAALDVMGSTKVDTLSSSHTESSYCVDEMGIFSELAPLSPHTDIDDMSNRSKPNCDVYPGSASISVLNESRLVGKTPTCILPLDRCHVDTEPVCSIPGVISNIKSAQSHFENTISSDQQLNITTTQFDKPSVDTLSSPESKLELTCIDTTHQSISRNEAVSAINSRKIPLTREQEVVKKDSGVDLTVSQKPSIGKFYYPFGKPIARNKIMTDTLKEKLRSIFTASPELKLQANDVPLYQHDFVDVALACNISRYFSSAMYIRACNGTDGITFDKFISFWTTHLSTYHTPEAILFGLLKDPKKSYLTPSDIEIVVKDVVQNHPGLRFLEDYKPFQIRYIETVVLRLFYTKPKKWNNQMTFSEFLKSRFVEYVTDLEALDDINKTVDIFSYQHFYVIYCKFWELDTDQQLAIDHAALKKYDRYSMTDLILTRVILGYGKIPSIKTSPPTMSYADFVWFILAVEDKSTPSAIEYWFRCLDLDGDGCLSLYEIKIFFDEQYQRMLNSRMSDVWKFEDFICSLFDLLKPAYPNKITLQDLKRSTSASLFFDMLFDLRKYETYTRRIDPAFREQEMVYFTKHTGETIRLEGFEKFAAKAYSKLSDEDNYQSQSAYMDFDESEDPKCIEGYINGVLSAEWDENPDENDCDNFDQVEDELVRLHCVAKDAVGTTQKNVVLANASFIERGVNSCNYAHTKSGFCTNTDFDFENIAGL